MFAATLIDPEALHQIRNLEVRARSLLQNYLRGIHRSSHHGHSTEFTEYRQYIPGEDTRNLDWRLYARTDRHYIRKYEDETNHRFHILFDQSRSMAYGSTNGYNKADYAATLAATLAYHLEQQHDATGLTTFDVKPTHHIPPRYRPGQLRRIFHHLEIRPNGEGTDLAATLEATLPLLRHRATTLLISDFLAPLQPVEQQLVHLRARSQELIMLQVLDPAELTLGLHSDTLLEDMESREKLHIDPQAAKKSYLQKLQSHLDHLKAFAAAEDIQYHLLPTNQPMELALLDIIKTHSA